MTNDYTIHCNRRLSRTRQPEQVYDHLLKRQGDVRTMMAVGGWSDYSAIEPYLAEPTGGRISEAMYG